MKFLYKFVFFLSISFGLGLNSLRAQAVETIPEDMKTIQYVLIGKKYLQSQSYLDAAQVFELGAERPFNQLTTTCIYMTGLSYFYMEEDQIAKSYFNRLIQSYPKSKFVTDAKYHKAIIFLKSEDRVLNELGLDLMLNLAATSNDEALVKDAKNGARKFLYDQEDPMFLKEYFNLVKPENKPLVFEVIIFQKYEEGNEEEARTLLQDYKNYDYPLSLNLRKLDRKLNKPAFSIDRDIRIAIVLPFYLNLIDSTAEEIPERCKRALEIFEGYKMALDDYLGPNKDKIKIRVFDSRKDTSYLKKKLPELGAFNPQIILGDIGSRTSKFLANWASENNAIQFIPLNPSNKIIKSRNHVFLTHPSRITHGKTMADYIKTFPEIKNVAVIYDYTSVSTDIANAFIANINSQFDSLGIKTNRFSIPDEFDSFLKEKMEDVKKELEGDEYQAFYLPLTDEVSAGFVISQLASLPYRSRIFGSPDWEYFHAIDHELKKNFKLTFTSVFYSKNDSSTYREFENSYIDEYGKFPSRFNVQGYDIMNYLLYLTENTAFLTDGADFVREAPKYKGIHQNVAYHGKQDNQEITILKYKNGRHKKVFFKPNK